MSVVFDAKSGRLVDTGHDPTTDQPVVLEAGHGRGKEPVYDHRRGGLDGPRGVPIIGHGSGAISLTAPGGELGNAARLEQAGRDIVRRHRQRWRYKP